MRHALLALLLLACDPASAPDAGAPSDAGGPADAGTPVDAALPDAGADAGGGAALYAITGACGELDDTELLGAGPSFFANVIDFPTGFVEATDAARLSEGGQEILRDGNAGGSSVESEMVAFEVLHRCEGAALLKTETEILYDDPSGKITDLLVTIDGHRIGISVTRAVAFPFDSPYPVDRATVLLEDKLADIPLSSANVSAADEWVKQILVVVAYAPMHGDSIRTAWEALDPAVRGDTILWVTVTDGDDAFLY